MYLIFRTVIFQLNRNRGKLKVCSQTRRKLRPANRKTTWTCILRHPRTSSLDKVQFDENGFRGASPLRSPCSRFEPAVRTPGGPVARLPLATAVEPALRREIVRVAGFQRCKLPKCGPGRKDFGTGRGRVTVSWWTHDTRPSTVNDFIMAARPTPFLGCAHRRAMSRSRRCLLNSDQTTTSMPG